ncbi:hypothetical protein ACFWPQ_17960 [Streptomyces sp. NPDC058464]|uniref:hypothetical protein n=1 Tax=Streptomyces sp. NPDC058464 TaxID=3346511 RepID=UPI00365E59F6
MRQPVDASDRKPPRTGPRPVPAPALGAWERSRRLGLREVRGPTATTAVAVHAEPPGGRTAISQQRELKHCAQDT